MNCDFCCEPEFRCSTVNRMLEDLTLLMIACICGGFFVFGADPTLFSELGGAFLMVLGASAAVIIYSAMIDASRIMALSMAGMLPIALTVQALILQNWDNRTYEINRYAMVMVFSVATALILVPFFAKLFRDSTMDAVKQYLWIVVILIVELLYFLGCEINGSREWVLFGSGAILWTVAVMPLVLTAFSVYVTDDALSPGKQFTRSMLFLAVCTCVLMSIDSFDLLKAITLTMIVLACIRMRDIKYLWLCVFIAGSLILALVLCSDFADSYQLEYVRQALSRSTLLPSDEIMFIPAAQNTNTFVALVQRLGLLFGFGVLGLVCIIFLNGLHICRHATFRAAGGVGLAFLVYLMVNAFVGTASSLGIFPVTDLDFPLLSSSGTAMFTCGFMLVYLLVLSSKENQVPEITWDAPRRQRAAVWGVVVCCVVIALTCVVLSFGGNGEEAPTVNSDSSEIIEPMPYEDYAAIVAEILAQAELAETAFPSNLTDGWDFPEYPYTKTAAHAYLDASDGLNANPFSAFYELYENGLFSKELLPAEPYQIVGFINESEVPQSGYLTDYAPEPRQYLYNDHDAQMLLYDILELSTWFENMMTNRDWLISMVTPDDFYIRFSSDDCCYYTYFLCQDVYQSWVLGFYFFPDAEQMYIENVEFQILQIAHDEWFGMVSDDWSRNVGSLISAIDYTMHGHSRFEDGACFQGYDGRGHVILTVPTACCCGEIQSALKCSQYIEGDDPENPVSVIELVSYRLHG